MWRTDTHWFDVSVATTVLMLGHLYFGRFEEHRPWWLPRRGVNGWTAEPRDRYYALLGLDANGKQR